MMHIIKGNKITKKNEGFKLLAMTYCQRFSLIVTGNDHFLNVQSFTGACRLFEIFQVIVSGTNRDMEGACAIDVLCIRKSHALFKFCTP